MQICCFKLLVRVSIWAVSAAIAGSALASDRDNNFFVWPKAAPNETSLETGTAQPPRKGENPPVTRVVNIRRPTVDYFLPENGNGTAVLILPGGGFAKVVPDKEGSEAAKWLNKYGIAAFVLSYRTSEAKGKDEPAYLRPLQDSQRALRIIRANSQKWGIDRKKVGVLAFSAGGQVGAVLHAAEEKAAYGPLDGADQLSCRPDFSMLIYPWRVQKSASEELLDPIKFTPKSPPAFIVHTHDDRSSALGSVMIYAELKRNNVPAELHVYQNGGHGYGMRPVKDSYIGSWTDRATEWLLLNKLATPSK